MLYSLRFQLLTVAPYDPHSISWDSVVLPLRTPGGACTRGSQQVRVIWCGLRDRSLGAVPQPRLLSPSDLHCRHFWEKRRHVSILLPQHGTALTLRPFPQASFFVPLFAIPLVSPPHKYDTLSTCRFFVPKLHPLELVVFWVVWW